MFAASLLSTATRTPATSSLLLRLAVTGPAGPSSAARFAVSPLLVRPYSTAFPGDDAKALKDQLKTALKTAMKARDTAQTSMVKVRRPGPDAARLGFPRADTLTLPCVFDLSGLICRA